MTQPELNEKKLAELAEMLELAKITEQKAQELCEFTKALDEKWKRKLEGRETVIEKVGEI
jgi:hypothetical protein